MTKGYGIRQPEDTRPDLLSGDECQVFINASYTARTKKNQPTPKGRLVIESEIQVFDTPRGIKHKDQ